MQVNQSLKGKTAELRGELEGEQERARPVREEADALRNKVRPLACRTARLYLFIYFCYSLCIFLIHRFFFRAQPVIIFVLSDLLDKPWSQMSSLPAATCLHFFSCIGFISIPTFQLYMLVDVYRTLLTHALALVIFFRKKSPCDYEHALRKT